MIVEPLPESNRVIEVVAFILSKHEKGDPVTLAADSPLKPGGASTTSAGGAPAAPAPAPAVAPAKAPGS